MPVQQEDILVRLDRTIASWNDEVTQAQSDLSRQIAETKDQLSTLARVLAARTKNGSALNEALQDVTRLKAQLRKHELEPETVAARPDPRSPAPSAPVDADAIDQMRREALALRETLRERDESLLAALDALREEIRAFRAHTAEPSQTTSLPHEELSSLRRAVVQALTATLPTGPAAIETELDEARLERDSLRAEAEGIHRERDALAGEMDSMQRRIGEAEALIRGSRAELEEVLRNTREQTEALETARGEIAELQAAREQAVVGERARTAENEGLRRKADDLMAALGESQKMAEAANQRVENARARQAEAEARAGIREAARDGGDTATPVAGELRASVSDMAISALREEVERTRAGRDAAEQSLQLIERQHESLAAELDRVRQEAASIWELRESLADERAAVSAARATMEQLEAERDAAHEAVRSLERQVELISGELERLGPESARAAELDTKLAGMESERDAIRAALEALERRHEALSAEADGLRQEAAAAVALAGTLEEERGAAGALRDSQGKLEAELEATGLAYEALQQEHAALLREAERSRQETGALEEARESLARVEAERDGAVHALQIQLEAVQVESALAVGERDEKLKALGERNEQLQAEIECGAALEEGRAAAERALAEAESSFEPSRAESQARLHALETELAEAHRALAEREETIAGLKAELERRDASRDQLQRELQDVQLQARSQREDQRTARDELQDALDETERLRREIPRQPPPTPRDDFDPPMEDDAERIVHASFDAQGRTRSMGEILVNAGIITPGQLRSALDEQRVSGMRRLGSILVERGLAREDAVARVLAAQTQAPFVQLAEIPVDPAALMAFGGELARRTMCFPVALGEGTITVAVPNPSDVFTIEEIEAGCGLKVEPVVATLADITSAIVRHFGVG